MRKEKQDTEVFAKTWEKWYSEQSEPVKKIMVRLFSRRTIYISSSTKKVKAWSFGTPIKEIKMLGK